MEVFLDESEPWAIPAGLQTLGEVLDALRTLASARQRSVMAITLDGDEITRLQQVELAAAPLDRFQTLTVTTVDPLTLSRDTLVNLQMHLLELDPLHQEAARLVRLGEGTKAVPLMKRCLDGWRLLTRGISDIARLCAIPLADIRGGDETLSRRMVLLQEQLGAFRSHFEKQDLVSIADVIEHELLPSIAHWNDMVLDLIARVDGKGRPDSSP